MNVIFDKSFQNWANTFIGDRLENQAKPKFYNGEACGIFYNVEVCGICRGRHRRPANDFDIKHTYLSNRDIQWPVGKRALTAEAKKLEAAKEFCQARACYHLMYEQKTMTFEEYHDAVEDLNAQIIYDCQLVETKFSDRQEDIFCSLYFGHDKAGLFEKYPQDYMSFMKRVVGLLGFKLSQEELSLLESFVESYIHVGVREINRFISPHELLKKLVVFAVEHKAQGKAEASQKARQLLDHLITLRLQNLFAALKKESKNKSIGFENPNPGIGEATIEGPTKDIIDRLFALNVVSTVATQVLNAGLEITIDKPLFELIYRILEEPVLLARVTAFDFLRKIGPQENLDTAKIKALYRKFIDEVVELHKAQAICPCETCSTELLTATVNNFSWINPGQESKYSAVSRVVENLYQEPGVDRIYRNTMMHEIAQCGYFEKIPLISEKVKWTLIADMYHPKIEVRESAYKLVCELTLRGVMDADFIKEYLAKVVYRTTLPDIISESNKTNAPVHAILAILQHHSNLTLYDRGNGIFKPIELQTLGWVAIGLLLRAGPEAKAIYNFIKSHLDYHRGYVLRDIFNSSGTDAEQYNKLLLKAIQGPDSFTKDKLTGFNIISDIQRFVIEYVDEVS
jgi:hypothetical protein